MKTKRRKDKIKPYIQGDFDGLCGLYSVINAIRICSNINEEACEEFFRKSLKLLSMYKDTHCLILDGLNRNYISKLVRLATEMVPIKISWPFYGKSDIDLGLFWEAMDDFINESPRNAAIVLLDGVEWGHWTVIRGITRRRMLLFDSGHSQVLNRSQCKVGNSHQEGFVTIEAHATCIISPQKT